MPINNKDDATYMYAGIRLRLRSHESIFSPTYFEESSNTPAQDRLSKPLLLDSYRPVCCFSKYSNCSILIFYFLMCRSHRKKTERMEHDQVTTVAGSFPRGWSPARETHRKNKELVSRCTAASVVASVMGQSDTLSFSLYCTDRTSPHCQGSSPASSCPDSVLPILLSSRGQLSGYKRGADGQLGSTSWM
jgi:hypothetical protein